MCLILFAYHANEREQLVVAANRDEFYARPTRVAGFWPEHPALLAGKDLDMGGTWLGITRNGRFAAVTNYRETPAEPLPPRSRGDLTRNFLLGDMSAEVYIATLASEADQYRGFNLLISDGDALLYFCNRDHGVRRLEPGIYGLSNHLLNCDWPKVVEGRTALADLLVRDERDAELFTLLAERGDPERPLSAKFIASPKYGTRCSTVLRVGTSGQVTFEERNFAADGVPAGQQAFHFEITP